MAQQIFPLTFTTQGSLFQTFTNNSSSANQDFGDTYINQYTLELVHKFPALFAEQTFALQTFPGQQFYTLPKQIRKVNTVVISVGNTSGTTTTGAGFNWPVKECPTMEYWNIINMTNNITSDIPLYYFVYNGQLGIYPKPANGYNPITIRAQAEISSVSQSDLTETKVLAIPYAGTLTTIPSLGSAPLTLTGNWSLTTGTYQILFSDGEIILATMTNGSPIIALQAGIVGTPNYPLALTASPATGATSATLTTNFTLSSGTYQMSFSDGEIITATMTNSSTAVTFATPILGTPTSIVSLNSSTGGNVVNISTAVTFRTSAGGDIVTGTSNTAWTTALLGYMFRVPNPTGDAFPYIVGTVYDTTHLALTTSYGSTAPPNASTVAASTSYTIGQISIIPTAYQLIPVYRSAELYYTIVQKDEDRQKKYKDLGDNLFAQLEDDYGNKDTDPTVQDDFGSSIVNPNLALNTTQSSTSQ